MPVAVRSVRNFPRSATGRRSILRARGSAAKTSAKSTTAWREIANVIFACHRTPPSAYAIIRAHASRIVGKRRQPGLVSVLRAEVAQDRIGKVTLHQFRHPRLPVVEIL